MKQLKTHLMIGAIFTLIVGTLAHFFYQWSGNNPLIGTFTPVNESTWEHMKLLFFPMLFIASILNGNLKQNFPCVTASLLFGILLGTFLIPVIFYVYSGVLGYNLLSIDIATFFISVIIAFYAAYKLTLSCRVENCKRLLTVLLVLLLICFIVFTYFPPAIGLFAIPASK